MDWLLVGQICPVSCLGKRPSLPAFGPRKSFCMRSLVTLSFLSFPSVRSALEMVDDALEAQDPQILYHILQDPILALKSLRRDNASWYLDQLTADREEKALVCQRAAGRKEGCHRAGDFLDRTPLALAFCKTMRRGSISGREGGGGTPMLPNPMGAFCAPPEVIFSLSWILGQPFC